MSGPRPRLLASRTSASRFALALVAVLLLVLGRAVPSSAQSVDLDGFEVEVFADGLDKPTGFDFLAAGELFVLERTSGRVEWIRDGKRVRTVLTLEVNGNGSRGALGIALDPDFATNGYVYIFYSAADASGAFVGNRLVRGTFNGTRIVKLTTLLEFPRDPGQENDPKQNGGTLRFAPDGTLYGQVGSLGRGATAADRVEQNVDDALASGVGGIFRVDTDGNSPSDNPFVADADPSLHAWFVYGFRDGHGLAFDPVSNDLWFTESGPGIYDELNRASAGTNSGWVRIIGPDKRDATYAANGNVPHDKTDLVRLKGSSYRDPLFSRAEAPGIGGLAFLDTSAYGKALHNQLVVGDAEGNLYLFAPRAGNRRNRLNLSGALRDRVADTDGERVINLWDEDFGAVHDLRVGPDDYLYASDRSGGRIILRIIERREPVEEAATYIVTFNATWSAATHPDPNFPGNPHFSGLIGATHTANVAFWEAGEIASDGIENMAETGSKAPLDDEVRGAIAAGTAEHLLSGGGIGVSPAAGSLQFEISSTFPLVTLVSMLAPSPDWFVGVSGLSLMQNGDWIDTLRVDLFTYDAGSDSGPSFNSSNDDTNPPQPIARISGAPFAVDGEMPRLGTFTFRRQQ